MCTTGLFEKIDFPLKRCSKMNLNMRKIELKVNVQKLLKNEDICTLA